MPWKADRSAAYDNGNGAMAYVTRNDKYPGIERVRVVPYAKDRGAPYTYYRLAGQGAGAHMRQGYQGYDTLMEAREARCYTAEDAE